MSHNVCTGTCGGVADVPGECQGEGCPKKGQSLTECDCGDGSHAAVMSGKTDESSS